MINNDVLRSIRYMLDLSEPKVVEIARLADSSFVIERDDVRGFLQKEGEAGYLACSDAVLAHFHDDVVFTSPYAAEFVPGSAGVVRGKAALREYWCTAIKAIPNLHFDIVGVYEGASVLVINYRNQGGTLVNEVLEFDGGLVRRGHGTYLVRG